jgi:integrase
VAGGLVRGRGAAAVRGGVRGEAGPKLEKAAERLQADAPNMRRPGADLITHYLDLDRLPVRDRWSRKHADTQRRLCERFAAPVIATLTCQDIKTEHTQKIVNAAPTAGEGDRVHRMISALVTAGIKAGYLTSPRLAGVHWQAGDRPLPAPAVGVAGESDLWVDPAEIPSNDDIGKLGQALSGGPYGERDVLMAYLAAYSGMRWGEIVALTIAQISQGARVITVDRKVVEVRGRQYLEAPKNRKSRRTIYPRRAPGGYPLAERFAARIEEARAEQEAGRNPLGLVFPSRGGGYWWSSNFNRRVLHQGFTDPVALTPERIEQPCQGRSALLVRVDAAAEHVLRVAGRVRDDELAGAGRVGNRWVNLDLDVRPCR